MPLSDVTALPYLTPQFPGIGGTLKQEPEDFFVEEIPLYEPSGEGEYLFLWVEKRDVAAEALSQHLARTLGIGRGDVGVAGLKDRRAITRQFVSVPASCSSGVEQVETADIRILNAVRHGNKLKTGHVRGNRFNILVRGPCEDSLARSEAIAEIIRQKGFPNYYGEQRFGYDGETLQLGLDLLTGRRSKRALPPTKRKFLERLSLSAVQSAMFNEFLARRITDGLLHRVLPGDVMQVRASGGPFVVDDVDREQARFEAGEIVISGPMYGLKMRHPTGPAAERERAVLDSFDLSPSLFASRKKQLPGTRRPLLAFPLDFQLEQHPLGLHFSYTLDRGAYATTLLREFMKSEQVAALGGTVT